jgi:adenylate kinase
MPTINLVKDPTFDDLEEVKQQEQEILNQKSQALKQYITDNLLPALTSGLIEVCNQQPEDPLDYLADFLINLSQKKSST